MQLTTDYIRPTKTLGYRTKIMLQDNIYTTALPTRNETKKKTKDGRTRKRASTSTAMYGTTQNLNSRIRLTAVGDHLGNRPASKGASYRAACHSAINASMSRSTQQYQVRKNPHRPLQLQIFQFQLGSIAVQARNHALHKPTHKESKQTTSTRLDINT